MADGRCYQTSSKNYRGALLGAAISSLALISSSALARPANGEFGPRSQATIEIKVSVAPRFVAGTSFPDRPNSDVAIASLAPGLRFHIVAKDRQATEPDRRNPLYLIVPD